MGETVGDGDRSPHSGEETGAIHRRLLAEGGLSGEVMSGIALEALERGDPELFIQATQTMRQSGDPVAVERAAALLDTYADIAEDGPGPAAAEQ